MKKGGEKVGNYIQIYDPIKEEINEIETILKSIGNSISSESTHEVFNHFFRMPGKYLRPTLILLAAKASNPHLTNHQMEQLVQLSVAVELIHSASLIHDDIIDGDLFRRGQKTLNNVYGKKIAVLAGDAMYAKAFSILSNYLPREAEQIITKVIEKMCVAEIEQAKENVITQQSYFNIIEGKTACFMSACCKLGAILAEADKEAIKNMEYFGLYFGMVYQIIDDCVDADASNQVTFEDAQQYAEKAMSTIEFIESNIYKQGLINLLNYILSYSGSIAKV